MTASQVNATLSGQYFVAAWTSMGTASYGMRLWDQNAALVYDSGAPAVVVTFAGGNWTYLGTEQLGVGRRYFWGINKRLKVSGRGFRSIARYPWL